MFTYGSASLQLFLVVWIFLRTLGIICYGRWVLSEAHKNYFKDWYLLNSQPTFPFLTNLIQWIMAIFSKGYKPGSYESHNSLKLSFMNILGHCLNFVDCQCFLESNSPDILALCRTNLNDSIDIGSLSVSVYPFLIWKNSATHIYGLAVFVKEELLFAYDLSLENSADSYLHFRLALLHSVSCFFFLYWSPSLSFCIVF